MAIYYHDYELGNNGNSGLSELLPKQDPSVTSYVNGDTSLLKRESTFLIEWIPDGLSDFTIDDYGTGERPIIDAESTRELCLSIQDCIDTTVRDLEAVNTSDSTSPEAHLHYGGFHVGNSRTPVHFFSTGEDPFGTVGSENILMERLVSRNHRLNGCAVNNENTPYMTQVEWRDCDVFDADRIGFQTLNTCGGDTAYVRHTRCRAFRCGLLEDGGSYFSHHASTVVRRGDGWQPISIGGGNPHIEYQHAITAWGGPSGSDPLAPIEGLVMNFNTPGPPFLPFEKLVEGSAFGSLNQGEFKISFATDKWRMRVRLTGDVDPDQEPDLWQALTVYAVDDIVVQTDFGSSGDLDNWWRICTQAGTSGASEPSWTQEEEDTVDGSVVWSVLTPNPYRLRHVVTKCPHFYDLCQSWSAISHEVASDEDDPDEEAGLAPDLQHGRAYCPDNASCDHEFIGCFSDESGGPAFHINQGRRHNIIGAIAANAGNSSSPVFQDVQRNAIRTNPFVEDVVIDHITCVNGNRNHFRIEDLVEGLEVSNVISYGSPFYAFESAGTDFTIDNACVFGATLGVKNELDGATITINNLIEVDPLFSDVDGGNYRPTRFSPAIGAAPFEAGIFDVDGRPFRERAGSTTDLGGYAISSAITRQTYGVPGRNILYLSGFGGKEQAQGPHPSGAPVEPEGEGTGRRRRTPRRRYISLSDMTPQQRERLGFPAEVSGVYLSDDEAMMLLLLTTVH